MAKKITELRIQRSVLRRVVQDKLQALLRGDFYVRNHLGEENYDPIVAEVKKLDEGVLMALMQHDKELRSQQQSGNAASASTTTTPPPTTQLQFSKELETFIQIIAASIMIDASMRGENAGESDTRFIKKKKKLLTRMLMGGKLYTLRREIVRFHLMNTKGVKEGSGELIEAIGVDPPETEVEEEEEESSEEESESEVEERPKKRKYNFSNKVDHDEVKSVGTMDEDSSDEDDDDDDDSLSDTATSENTSLSKSGAEDGFSTSAASSKKMKKAKKKARKEEKRRLKKERKRIKKEKKRKEKEEKKRKRKLEKELKKRKKMKHHHGHEKHRDNREFMEEEFDNDMDDADEVELDMNGQEEDETMLEEVPSFEFKTKEEFENYRDDVIGQIPKSIRKRFRQGGFSKWGKDWLPVIELGPFDVEPGPVREMWMDMFHNTQKSGRDMTHLVFWYGVKFEDRGQGFSFVPDGKIVPYSEGERKGYNKIPKKIQSKIDKNQKLTKTEEQIKNGLKQIVSDMTLEKGDRIKWMMNFKEDYELAIEAEEEAAKAAAVAAEKAAKPKRKPGRPKKEESVDKPKRGPGRPKKVVDGEAPPKRKPGRPKKSEQEKAASKAKKFQMVDEDQPETDIDTDDDDEDENYGDDNSDSDDDLKADTDSDTGGKKKLKPTASAPKKPGRKPAKPNMTEEEKAQERREKAAAYREKKAREKAEALGLEYVPGRKGRKSKATIMEEEQMKFMKCEEVFLPLMERLEKAQAESDAAEATECLNLLMKRVELVTPPFLRSYGLGMAVKQTRKAFESAHPAVKDQCKKLTNEMKRLYTERDKNIPDEFEPVKNMKDEPQPAAKKEEEKKKKRKEKGKVPSVIKSEQPPPEKIVVEAASKVKPEPPQKQPEKPQAAKLTSLSSTGSLPNVVKTEPQKKQQFSIKGMFEKPKPKPVPRPKNIAAPNVVVSDPQMSPRAPKSLPSWVTGPALKNDFHEQHVKERSFGLEFLIDAASKVASERFDPVRVSQSFELAIFAETKLRGRDWKQYWEKIYDIVAMLSPGKNKPNAILQGIKSGNYQEPSELVKLSRREIETVNNLR